MESTVKRKPAPILCLVLMVPVLAATARAETLGITDCTGMALKGSQQAMSAALKFQTAELGYKETQAGYLPSVSFSSPGVTWSGDFGGEAGRGQLSASLTVRQSLGQFMPPTGLLANTTSMAQRLAAIDLEMARLDNAKTILGLGYDTRNAYVGVLKARKNLGLATEQRKDMEERLLPQTKAKLDAGVATTLDLTKVQNQLADAVLAELKAANAVDSALRTLSRLVGKPMGSETVLDPAGSAPEALMGITPDKALAKAKANRTEAVRAKLALEQAELNLQRAMKSNAPAFTLSSRLGTSVQASLGSRDMVLNGTLNLSEYKASTLGASAGGWQVGLGVAAPILDWGVARMEAQGLRNGIEAARIALAQAEQAVESDVISAYQALGEGKLKLANSRNSIEADQTGLRITRARYEAGVASLSELLDAEAAMFQGRTTLAQAEYDLYLLCDKLAQSMGLAEGRAE